MSVPKYQVVLVCSCSTRSVLDILSQHSKNKCCRCSRKLPKVAGVVGDNNVLLISINEQVVFSGKVEHAPENIDLRALEY